MTLSQHYICCTCGTKSQNDENGYCANGHDDWIQFDELLYLLNSDSVPGYKGYPKDVLSDQLSRLHLSLYELYNTSYTIEQIIKNFYFFTL